MRVSNVRLAKMEAGMFTSAFKHDTMTASEELFML